MSKPSVHRIRKASELGLTFAELVELRTLLHTARSSLLVAPATRPELLTSIEDKLSRGAFFVADEETFANAGAHSSRRQRDRE